MPSQPATASRPPQRVAGASGGDGSDLGERLTRLEEHVKTLATKDQLQATKDQLQERLAASEERLGKRIEQVKESVDELNASLKVPRWIIGIVGGIFVAFITTAGSALVYGYFSQVGRSLALDPVIQERLSQPAEESE